MLQPNTRKGEPPQASSVENAAPPLHFNLLPFRYPQDAVEMSFTLVPLDGLYPFKPGEVPAELTGKITNGQPPGCFYTSALPDGPGIPLKVSLNNYPALAALWCTQQLRRLLEPVVSYTQHCGPRTTQFWCSTKPPATDVNGTGSCIRVPEDRQAFHRFTVRVLHRKELPHPLLLIGYNGIGCILKASLEDLAGSNPDTRTINRVAFRGMICRWKELPHTAWYHLNEVHPLLSGKMARWLQPEPLSRMGSTANGNSFPLITAFLKTYLHTGILRSVAVHDSRFLEVAPATTGRIPSAEGRLLFGEEGISADPVEGMMAYGPCKLPAGSHFSCFTVCFEQDKHLAQKLFECVVATDASRRLGQFMRVPIRFSHDHSILLSRDSAMEQQLVRRLMEMEFDPAITWCAFFICPGKEQLPCGEAKKLHARITELLLHRGVLVQTVKADSLEGELCGPLHLTGMDVVARLGGIPWRPEGNNLSDPVVGFAVHSCSNPPGPGVGAAVFFAPGGQFAGAGSFNPAHEREWGGLSVEFLKEWELSGQQVRRLVLHLPRRLKKQELASLQAMIDEWKPGLQVIEMSIRRCRSRDIQVFSSDARHGAIGDGTWVRCSARRYLLYTRGRPGSKNAVPLTIRFRILNGGDDTITRLAPGLLDQLHSLTRMHFPGGARHGLPVTLTYPARLARMIPRLRSRALPEFAREVPWFI